MSQEPRGVINIDTEDSTQWKVHKDKGMPRVRCSSHYLKMFFLGLTSKHLEKKQRGRGHGVNTIRNAGSGVYHLAPWPFTVLVSSFFSAKTGLTSLTPHRAVVWVRAVLSKAPGQVPEPESVFNQLQSIFSLLCSSSSWQNVNHKINIDSLIP